MFGGGGGGGGRGGMFGGGGGGGGNFVSRCQLITPTPHLATGPLCLTPRTHTHSPPSHMCVLCADVCGYVGALVCVVVHV
jgi:hypothetical protein